MVTSRAAVLTPDGAVEVSSDRVGPRFGAERTGTSRTDQDVRVQQIPIEIARYRVSW